MILLQHFHSFLIKRNTKLSLFSRVVLAKRFGGNRPDMINKAVKDGLKIMGPHIAEAAASQPKTEASTSEPQPKTTTGSQPNPTTQSTTSTTEQQTKGQSNPQHKTPSLVTSKEIVSLKEKTPDILKFSGKKSPKFSTTIKNDDKTDVNTKESTKKQVEKPQHTSIGAGYAAWANYESHKTSHNETKGFQMPIISLFPKPFESPKAQQSIPKAPPLPPTPKSTSSQYTPVKVGISHTEQIKHLAEIQNNPDQLDVKAIPQSEKLHWKKSYSGKPFQTIITKDTTPQDLTREQLLDELKKRELIKVDEGKTAVKVTLADDSEYLLGDSKNKVKLTPLGQAYAAQTSPPKSEPNLFVNVDNANNDTSAQFMIVVPPKSSENLLIETGKQKHLLVVRTANNEYKAIGYLTSKISPILFKEQQFIKFQKQQEGKEPEKTLKDKKQYFALFQQPVLIKDSEIIRVKYDEDYINSLTLEEYDQLVGLWKITKNKVAIPFDKDGITETKAVEMCIACDTNFDQKKPHPMTPDQIQQQQKGKEKQKAQQAQEAFAKNNKPDDIS